MIFAPPDAKPENFRIDIRPGDVVVPVCREGTNGSQIMYLAAVGALRPCIPEGAQVCVRVVCACARACVCLYVCVCVLVLVCRAYCVNCCVLCR